MLLKPIESGQWSQNHTYKKALLKGYASSRPLPNYIELISLLGLSKTIGIIGFTVKRKTWNNIHFRPYHKHRLYLEEFFKQSS
jgi:hypothetical protein